MSYKNNIQYMEGQFAAKRIIPVIGSTTYETIEGAVITKQAVVDKFEGDLGFSREMEDLDSDYAYTLGMLDTLKEHHENGEKNEE